MPRRTEADVLREFQVRLHLMEPRLAEAFLRAVSDVANSISLADLIDAIDRRDFMAVQDLFQGSGAAFGRMDDLMDEAFRGGARLVFDNVPPIRDPYTGSQLIVGFNGRNPRAEQVIRQQSATLVQNVGAAPAILPAIRTTIEMGVADGRSSRVIALDITGRVNPVTRLREGGIVGLTDQSAEAIARTRRILSSGDPEAIKQLVAERKGSGVWPHRYDDKLKALAEDGKTIPAKTVDALVKQYTNNSLNYRGKLIAQTEANTATAAGQREAFSQLIEQGLPAENVTKMWRWNFSKEARSWHKALSDRKLRVPFNEPFPDMGGMMYPHDPVGGIGNSAGCKCGVVYRINGSVV